MLQDLLYAWRTLRKSPGFTTVAVLTLALGIGASTAMFSVINAILLRPMPYAQPEQLVRLWEDNTNAGFPQNTPAPANYFDWKVQAKSYSHIAAFRRQSLTLASSSEPTRLEGMLATADLFPLLGVQPALGRTFESNEDDAGAPMVALLSHSLWRSHFGGDRQVIGKSVLLDGQKRVVVGVMPAGFSVPGFETDVWVPFAWTPQEKARRGSHFLQVMGRLRPGVTLAQAQSELSAIAKRLEMQYPESNSQQGAVVVALREQLSGRERPMLLALMGTVGFLLLIACANVAGLLVARAAARQREVAVRAALGASRIRMLRMQLAESGILAALACAAGIAMAAWTRDAVRALMPGELYGANEIELDPLVLGFSIALTTLTAVLAAIAPSVLAWRTAEAETLRQGSRGQVGGRARARQFLVALEVGLSVVMLTGAGLFLQSFLRLQRQQLGYDADHVLTLRVAMQPAAYPKDEDAIRFYRSSIERIQALPGVESAGWTYRLPATMAGGASMITIEGRPAPPRGQEIVVPHRYITTGYLKAMRMQLVQGRLLEERDTQGPTFGVVVNETFAKRYFPGGSALQQTFVDANEEKRCRIVGVMADVREFTLSEPARPAMYIPLEAAPLARDLAVRTKRDPLSMAAAVRREIRAVDANLAVSHVQTMEDILDKAVAGPRLQMVLAGVFALLALLITGVGLAGVVAQSVADRTAEIGLRVALGARRGSVLGLVFRQGLIPAGAGLLAGVALSLACARFVQGLLFEVKATDTGTFLLVPFVLALVALLAMLLPALRALRIEPMSALRND
jgi:predicted permease